MTLMVNGESRETTAATVSEYLTELNIHARMVVVEHNGQIVPKDNFGETLIKPNDALEIVQMMAGG